MKMRQAAVLERTPAREQQMSAYWRNAWSEAAQREMAANGWAIALENMLENYEERIEQLKEELSASSIDAQSSKLKLDAIEDLVIDHLAATDWRDDTEFLRELRRMFLTAEEKAEMIAEGVIHE